MRFCPRCYSIYDADVPRCSIDGAALEVTEDDPLLGREVAGYTVLSRIGFGSTGAVYRVENASDRPLAMKVLFGDFAASEQVVARFLGSAAVAANIDHDNVVVPSEYGRTDTGLCFIVMPHIPGRTLRTVLDGARRLAPNRAANIVVQIAAGLQAAHQAGCIHRDIKPTNVLVSIEKGRERARLVDFGLAVLTTQLPHHPELVGTPIYMAPELARAPSSISGSADLYALGVMTYEMLSGQPPFDGTGVVDLVMKHSLETPPALDDAGGLELIANWLLEKNPSDRPTTAQMVVDEIGRLDLEPYIPPKPDEEEDTLSPRPALDAPQFDEEEVVTEDLVPHPGVDQESVRRRAEPFGMFGGEPTSGPHSRDAVLGYEFLRGRFDLIKESIHASALDGMARSSYEDRLEMLRRQLTPNQAATTYVDLAGRLAALTGEIRAAGVDNSA